MSEQHKTTDDTVVELLMRIVLIRMQMSAILEHASSAPATQDVFLSDILLQPWDTERINSSCKRMHPKLHAAGITTLSQLQRCNVAETYEKPHRKLRLITPDGRTIPGISTQSIHMLNARVKRFGVELL